MTTKTVTVTVGGPEPPSTSISRLADTKDFILMHTRADRMLRAVLRDSLKSYKVGIMEWLVLSVVKAGPSSKLSIGDISDTLGSTLPQTNLLIAKLLKRKLIKQKTERADRRVQHITLTAKGRALYAGADESIVVALRNIRGGTPKNTIVFYERVLAKLAKMPQD